MFYRRFARAVGGKRRQRSLKLCDCFSKQQWISDCFESAEISVCATKPKTLTFYLKFAKDCNITDGTAQAMDSAPFTFRVNWIVYSTKYSNEAERKHRWLITERYRAKTPDPTTGEW